MISEYTNCIILLNYKLSFRYILMYLCIDSFKMLIKKKSCSATTLLVESDIIFVMVVLVPSIADWLVLWERGRKVWLFSNKLKMASSSTTATSASFPPCLFVSIWWKGKKLYTFHQTLSKSETVIVSLFL